MEHDDDDDDEDEGFGGVQDLGFRHAVQQHPNFSDPPRLIRGGKVKPGLLK